METAETEEFEVRVEEIEEVTVDEVENEENNEKSAGATGEEKQRLVKLPLARVKTLMKVDPDCGIVSQDAVFLITKATEMFITFVSEHLAEEVANSKRKTVMRKDVDAVMRSVPKLYFLDGTID